MDLTEWERLRLQTHAAANAITFVGHFSKGGSWSDDELAECNRWRRLSDKLAGKAERADLSPADFPEARFRAAEPAPTEDPAQ